MDAPRTSLISTFPEIWVFIFSLSLWYLNFVCLQLGCVYVWVCVCLHEYMYLSLSVLRFSRGKKILILVIINKSFSGLSFLFVFSSLALNISQLIIFIIINVLLKCTNTFFTFHSYPFNIENQTLICFLNNYLHHTFFIKRDCFTCRFIGSWLFYKVK